MKYDVIIPTLNAEKYIGELLRRLLLQTILPECILVLDSQSDDSTQSIARSFSGVQVIQIARSEFDHGGTRDFAIRNCQSPYFVLMTQDACPIDNCCMEKLLSPFSNEKTAAVCGRQIAYPDAYSYEREIRNIRYSDVSRRWNKKDIEKLGLSAFQLSDAFAAYSREAYLSVGGFEHPINTNEDMLIASEFLKDGYDLVYCAEAKVWHSHNFSFQEEYRRNKQIGEFLEMHSHSFDGITEMGDGFSLVRSVTSQLMKKGRITDIFPFYVNCAARLLGNRAGRKAGKKRLPHEQ